VKPGHFTIEKMLRGNPLMFVVLGLGRRKKLDVGGGNHDEGLKEGYSVGKKSANLLLSNPWDMRIPIAKGIDGV
jgi:hypothetical protein